MIDTFLINWRGIEVTVRYHPNRWKSYGEVYGVPLDHIQIESKMANPISETGYKSHYIRRDTLSEWNSITEYVETWLNTEAETPEWKEREAAARQLTLF